MNSLLSLASRGVKSYSWEDIDAIIWQMAVILPAPNAIIGISRGGLLPAVRLSHHWNIREFHTLDAKQYDHMTTHDIKLDISQQVSDLMALPTTLVVDDIMDSGTTFEVLRRISPSCQYACVIAKRRMAGVHVGLYTQPTEWVEFPWEKAHE